MNRAGDHRADARQGEAAIHRQPESFSAGTGRGLARGFLEIAAEVADALAGEGADRENRTLRQSGGGQELANLSRRFARPFRRNPVNLG